MTTPAGTTTATTPVVEPALGAGATRTRRALQVAGTLALLGGTALLVDPAAIAARLVALDVAWLLAALACAVPMYLAMAARWWLTARRLDAPVGAGRALAEYQLSTFLNQALPLGIAGDALRALRHGRRLRAAGMADGLGRAIRVVVLERLAGLAALGVVVAVAAVSLLGTSPLLAAVAGAEAVVVALGLGFLIGLRGRRPDSQRARLAADARRAFAGGGALSLQLALSLIAVGSLVAMFHCAGRAAGAPLTVARSIQIVPIVLAASTLPLAFGGWGVREAITAALYAALGVAPALGAAVAVTFGAVALVASAPGLLVALVPNVGPRAPLDPARRHALGHAVTALVGVGLALAFDPRAFAVVAVVSLALWVVAPMRPWASGQLATLANAVTAARLAALTALPFLAPRLGDLAVAAIAFAVFALDGVDGALARRRGAATPLGAALDQETDAIYVMTVGLLLAERGVVGPWVLIAGLWRYAYGVLVAIVPSRGEAPRSSLGRLIAGALMLSLAGSFLLGAGRAWPAAALGTALVSYSFLRGIAWSYRRPTTQSNSTSGPSETCRQSSAIASDS